MKEVKHNSILSNIFFFCRQFLLYEPLIFWCSLTEILCGTLIPYLGIYLPKLTIDLLEKKVSVSTLMLQLGGFILIMMLANGLSGYVGTRKGPLMSRMVEHLNGLLFLKSLRVKYSDAESGNAKQILYKAYNGTKSCWNVVSTSIEFMVKLLCFLLYSTVLSTLNPWLILILIGMSALNYLIGMHQLKYLEGLRADRAENDKHFWYIKSAMGNTAAAKDIRIFGMRSWLLNLRDEVLKVRRYFNHLVYFKYMQCGEINYVLAIFRDIAAYTYLIYRAVEGSISIGEFVLYFGAIGGFAEFVTGMVDCLYRLRYSSGHIDCIRAYLTLPDEDLTSGTRHISELKEPISITFENVCFSYQSADEENENTKEPRTILKNFNYTIHAGEKVALVGVNGIGKTTLVKLLCGMYTPDSGTILLNGIDYRTFPKEELYQLFSVIFQETFILPFTVGENLAMTTSDKIDEKRAWDALSKAGLKSVFEEKGITLQTFMKKAVSEHGIELSGGQLQRFLLARALYKNAPLLILDEPTAALDPIAESEVYDNYCQFSQGKTSLFISHRLASTRFSDRIILLNDGQVQETGTHEELMKLNGTYAEMFRIQSHYYTDGEEVSL